MCFVVFAADGVALGAAVSTSKTEVEVIVFVAIMLHKVDNDSYFYYYFIYGRIPKICPGTYIFQRPFLRGLFLEGLIFGGASTEGNLRFKIKWASLIFGSKLTIFALSYFVFEGNFPSTSPQGGLYLEGRFNGGFFALLVWGAYIWRGLFSEFYGVCKKEKPLGY